ncbi:T9SS type A sorting domain-containing protein [Hymenobacter sp. 15J16-1T3B]|uniref:T9SS type A sorting domain-containing protein n=1 Tax=Hymenobacter sp. 15J16-1T3B TaxID=2886941 RepID=UPI001D11ED1C|nr:T9SS type A sorting domain-containing protein [Hymenobacter sp. 15J16-1T3B]MCC3158854.1 T9SS type A sorting domain-containing protein [Hymenobacter sp. 15J16-1T3B]
MKYLYRLLVLTGLTALSFSAAQGQDWRPFRPGLIYSYSWSTTNATHTLRLDSAYVAGTDSVYAFNRVLRPTATSAYQFRSSRNNIMGARLICRPAQREYALETLAESGLAAQTLVLRPRVAIGSSWAATPTLTATLTSRVQRTWGLAPNVVTDSVATITLSNGRIIELSRAHGLLRGPSNWTTTAVDLLQGNTLPVPYQESVYSPLVHFDFQPGDEFGYISEDSNPLPCFRNFELRRILTRQQTADSLIYTYQSQKEFNRYGGPGHPCGFTASYTLQPMVVGRMAVPLRRPQWSNLNYYYTHSALGLLTYEYARLSPAAANSLLMGEALTTGSGGCPRNGRQLVSYARMYLNGSGSTSFYTYGVDAAGGTHTYASGVGEVNNFEWYLQYYRKLQPGGTYATCGTRTNFNALLPSREAQSAARLQLYPNPAAHEATLQLQQPAPAAARLSLLDALGREVRRQALGRGETKATVPLTGLPAGLYVVQLQLPGEAPLVLRLQHID